MKTLIGNQGPRNKWASYIDWSEDRVQNWQASSPVAEGTNECQVVELADGTLMLNMRNYQQKGVRAVSISRDRGRSWARPWVDQRLIVPVCQASFLRCTDEHHNDKNRLLFANPADTRCPGEGYRRRRLVVRLSYDEGKTWPVAKCLHYQTSAYSCLTVLPDMRVGLLNEKDGYSRIVFSRFS